MVSSPLRPAAIDRTALIRGGLFGALANALVAGSPLYVRPLQDALWQRGDDGRLLLLVGIALALFAVHALLDFERARSLARLLPAGLGACGHRVAGLDRVWLIDAGWVPVHLLVLGVLHPVLGALALAGVAAVAAIIALCAAGPTVPREAASGPWQGERRLGGGVFGHPDAFDAGMRFCETVYRVLVVGLAAALLVQGELQPGQFVAGALIGVMALRSAVRAAALWRGCGGPVGDAP
ncbi:hypothetical protein [Azospirillum sp. TSO35-2]|uniref:hypothetical protein n=1 Tax=Azospirillum sp. TSO35-2 TaxID=716796 RepID=UPI000D6047F7|nr:hypothetical protein [Azospirillum sp. TSO35-2]PWC31262.1 hypothetical protein TSO352_31225 [Azospirillum sp. TSO35-2]